MSRRAVYRSAHAPAMTPAVAVESVPAPARGRLRRVRGWLCAYERVPEPLAPDAASRRALWAVVLAALAYMAVISAYCFGLQATFRTHAEELGIMDQVLWNTVHGRFMQESICNSI